jgi:hypothetical protein
MNDTADPSSRRYRFSPRVLFSFAIFALSISLVPAYVTTVGVATIGEAEATTHVETTEAVADRKGEHNQRRRTAAQRMRWHRRLLATRRIEARIHWHRRQGWRLPLSPCDTLAPTRAPPTVR